MGVEYAIHQQAMQGLGILATHYRERWPELSELPPEDICNFLSTEGWIWNPDIGLNGRWEKNDNHQEGDKPNGEEETR
jgi:hypothetical protein